MASDLPADAKERLAKELIVREREVGGNWKDLGLALLAAAMSFFGSYVVK